MSLPRWAFAGAAGSVALGLIAWLGAALGGAEPPRADAPASMAGASPPVHVAEPETAPRTEPSIAPVRAPSGNGASDRSASARSVADHVGAIRPSDERAAVVRVAPIDEPEPAASLPGSVGSASPRALHDATQPAGSERGEAARNEALQGDPERDTRGPAPEKKHPPRTQKSKRPARADTANVSGAAPATSTEPPPAASEAYRMR